MTVDPQFLDALYRGVEAQSGFDEAMDLLAARFNARSLALISLDATSPRLSLAYSGGALSGAARQRYLSEFSGLDPAPGAYARVQPGVVVSTDRLLDQQVHRHSIFLHEFFLPLGLVETIGATLGGERGRFELVGIQRGDDRAAFSADDLAALEAIAPHLRRALQLRRAFFDLEQRLLGLEASLDRLSGGLAVLDPHGLVRFANAALHRLLARRDGLSLDRAGHVVVAEGDARRRLDRLLVDVRGTGAGGLVQAPRADGRPPYAVLVAPLPAGFAALGRHEAGGGALLLVHDPDARAMMPVERLQEALHLPRGAAEVVLALCGDGDLAGFARERAITIHTARFHLRTALAQTGTRSQVELVRLALRLLRDLGLDAPGEP